MEKEIPSIIYDTLMKNTDNEQLDVSFVENQSVSNNVIEFDYKGHNVFMVIKITNIKSLI